MGNQEKFILKGPIKGMGNLYRCSNSGNYFMHDGTDETPCCKCGFTQSEIDIMPFDATFFTKLRKEEL